MSTTLHAATVGVFLQVLPSIAGLIDKAEAHCRERGLPPEALTDARLAPDMWPFAQQVSYVVLSSAGAVEALRAGVTGPHMAPPAAHDFAHLREAVGGAIALLDTVTPEQVQAAADRDVTFEFGSGRMEYVAQDFLLSFSLLNFFFHASMAYSILRNQGVEVGKRDFLGRVRVKT